jgi:DNA invertase Pin-like site-specific DNA recombinase
MKQVGNISTDMQQIDLPRHVHSLGWAKDNIVLIDEDEGVSGAKRIDERKGMSRLYNLIINRSIGTVAVQAEDRLFRDETQIQVNVFIDACVKSDVRVITPYFKYNFADKNEGSYHRLLFRMRAEQAADYLNSYVRGRLMAAKERMLLQGMWMGGNINLGYMVDNRKMLSNGVPNPAWRKFVPFEPCAEVVVGIFKLFIEKGGNINATIRHLLEYGPHFPDFDNPEIKRLVPNGFDWAKPLRMLKRDNVYITGSMQLTNMLTNPVYLGHWMHREHIVVWDNHPAIVPEDLFYKAFNYLSPYTFEGKPNPDYAPRLGRVHSTKRKDIIPLEAIYLGLLGTYHEGKWRGATASWRKGMNTYAYSCNYMDSADNSHHLWSRQCEYLDNVLTEVLHAKLRSTFDSNIWEEVLQETDSDFESEHRMLSHQLATIEQKMQALVGNFHFVQSETLLKALEKEYADYEQEKARLQSKLTDLNKRIENQDSLMLMAKQAEKVLANWDVMNTESKQLVAQAFISRIIVTPTGKHRVIDVEICWNDNTHDHIQIAHKTDESTIWFPWEVETLAQFLKDGAGQITIASALPNRNWHAIRLKAYEIIGKRNFYMSPKPIRDEEKYEDYLARVERDGEKEANRTSGNRWTKDEIAILEEMVGKGATQLEIACALPIRTWEAMRKKIVKLYGNSLMVKEVGALESAETILDYLERNPHKAGAMPFSILTNSSQQRQTRKPSHLPRALAREAQALLQGLARYYRQMPKTNFGKWSSSSLY